jgi:hypothetical protein
LDLHAERRINKSNEYVIIDMIMIIMAKVEVRTAEQRLEVAGERQFQQNWSSPAFGQSVNLHISVEQGCHDITANL